MTDVTSRPMTTPDLATLLRRPRRPTAETPPVGPISGEAPVVQGDTTDGAEHTASATEPPEIPPSERPGADELVRERKQRRPKPAGEAAVSSAPTPVTGREYLRTKSIYLPRSLHQRLGEFATARKTTRTALILTAINQTHSQLGAYLASENASAGGGGREDLFDIPQDKKDTEPAVQTTIRITDRQHQAIETLIEKLGANRSQLVAAALRLYLV